MSFPVPEAVEQLLPAPTDELTVRPHLAAIDAQAAEADRTRSLDRAMVEGCAEVDRRIASVVVPDEADYFRQQAIVTMAVDQLEEAMDLLARTLGGNGLREASVFDRLVRDFRAMPLHINVHQDRISHQLGRLALGIDLDPF